MIFAPTRLKDLWLCLVGWFITVLERLNYKLKVVITSDVQCLDTGCKLKYKCLRYNFMRAKQSSTFYPGNKKNPECFIKDHSQDHK